MNAEKSIFERIIDREIPATIVYEDDLCLAFEDVNPQASTHVLVVPKKPIRNLADLSDEDQMLMGHLMLTIQKVAVQLDISDAFRVVSNCGSEAGQTVFHLHFHVMAGNLPNAH